MATPEDIESLVRDLTLGNQSRKPRREALAASPTSPTTTEKKDHLQRLNDRLAQRPRKKRASQGFGRTAPPKNIPAPPTSDSILFVLGYPNRIVGIFSTVEKGVIAAAILCNAHDTGLSKWDDHTGMRVWGNDLRLLPKPIIQPETDEFEDFEVVEAKKDVATVPSSVYAALQAGLCLGLFLEKPDAWDACLKHKSQVTYSTSLREESKWIDKDGMPHVEGILHGSGWHRWCVKRFVVDAVE